MSQPHSLRRRRSAFRVVLCGLALTAGPHASTAAGRAVSLAGEAERALAGDQHAIARLREAGPGGLSAFLDAAALGQDATLGPQASAALDRICAQRHCAASRLYWYTDLAAAKAEAARRGVPIVSLRLLGRLDEEQSCANSRYFRVALYSDPAVSTWLRDNAVLHWSSERPVPRVSIDFGDGRRLEGTVTGNSAHYLLDSRGRPIDVLPGLYSPSAFRRWLESAAPLSRAAAGYDDRELARRLRALPSRRARRSRDDAPARPLDAQCRATEARGRGGDSPVATQSSGANGGRRLRGHGHQGVGGGAAARSDIRRATASARSCSMSQRSLGWDTGGPTAPLPAARSRPPTHPGRYPISTRRFAASKRRWRWTRCATRCGCMRRYTAGSRRRASPRRGAISTGGSTRSCFSRARTILGSGWGRGRCSLCSRQWRDPAARLRERPACHPERSEGSGRGACSRAFRPQILRFAQDDIGRDRLMVRSLTFPAARWPPQVP